MVQFKWQDWTRETLRRGESSKKASEVIVKIEGDETDRRRKEGIVMSIIFIYYLIIALLAMIISSTVRIIARRHIYVVEHLSAYQEHGLVRLPCSKSHLASRVAEKSLKRAIWCFPPHSQLYHKE